MHFLQQPFYKIVNIHVRTKLFQAELKNEIVHVQNVKPFFKSHQALSEKLLPLFHLVKSCFLMISYREQILGGAVMVMVMMCQQT